MADSSYQDGAIKRYYANRDTKSLQTLAELASDLFLCEDTSQAKRLWDRVGKALQHVDADAARAGEIVSQQDVKGLTRLVNELTAPGRPASGAASTASPSSASTTRGIPARPAEQSSGSDEPVDIGDKQVLKRAMKAFRKRLKLTRLDEESKIGVGPLSGGKQSKVVAINPPTQFPQAVWDELVKQGRLTTDGHGFYSVVEQ